MDNKNFTIGILSTTATILFVGLLLIDTRPPAAYAGAMTATTGPYTATVSTRTRNDEEVVMIVNAPEQKMIAYRYNAGKREIEVVNGVDMAADFKSASANQGNQRPNRRGNRRP